MQQTLQIRRKPKDHPSMPEVGLETAGFMEHKHTIWVEQHAA